MERRMTWEKIRQAFPKRFVLLKNCRSSRSGNVLTILAAEVVESSEDGKDIFHRYREHKNKERVLFGYTGWEQFEVEERPFLGIRPANG